MLDSYAREHCSVFFCGELVFECVLVERVLTQHVNSTCRVCCVQRGC